MDKSAIIISEVSSGNQAKAEDTALWKFNGKTILSQVVDSVTDLVDEVIIVASSKDQADTYEKIVSDAKIILCEEDCKGTLPAALQGFESAQGKHVLVLTSDSLFVSFDVVTLLFDLSPGKSAVVPRWPGENCEALQAVYDRCQALDAGKKALDAGEVDLASILPRMRGVRYISTMVIEQLDPDFKSFFHVKTMLDLKKAAVMTKPRKSKTK